MKERMYIRELNTASPDSLLDKLSSNLLVLSDTFN